MMSIKEYLFNFIHGSESVYEMVTISKNERWGNNQYRIATHGTATGDRENPHVHIYLIYIYLMMTSRIINLILKYH